MLISISMLKRTPAALAAAVKHSPKIAAKIKAINVKINVLKKKALKAYLIRHKADIKKAAEHKAKKSHSTTILADSLSAGKTVSTVAEKKAKGVALKHAAVDPKVALRRKQMSAAMRIRENKDLAKEIRGLRATREKLHDQAWAIYQKAGKGGGKTMSVDDHKKALTASKAALNESATQEDKDHHAKAVAYHTDKLARLAKTPTQSPAK